ncbi:fungal-specific transcription factor domain-containing protein [Penicillium angulare]|uniref:fungal-specific transcription factor domain-containing protein n=1 Tax=Penicillium angulare TaxID=116970 RepID=UPI0025410092|nr:fungal-specific transcription factor domain-containing protein [Penicillium angulare]KAJ5279795.1 fungal-specific transcription factor domain-containing protein [Penicillium angulare]
MPNSQNLSPVEREHRIRIWWSIYILDRYWGSKSGFPIQIHDDDIHVDFPSVFTFKDYGEQFSEVTYQIAAIELAKITGCMMKEIYTQKKSSENFLKREQRILIYLQQWINSLPESLRIFTDKANSKHIVLLHLQFNYCVVLAIRPVLLKFLNQHQKHQSVMHLDEESKRILMTLSQACINAARYSLRLCLKEWTSGSLVIFGYAFPAFLFSSGLVLAIASLLPMGHNNDLAAFETSMEMLKVLNDSNNIAAKDLYEHSLRVQRCINNRESLKDIPEPNNIDEPRDVASSFQETTHREALGPERSGLQPCLDDVSQMLSPTFDFQHCEFTTEMVLQSSMMQDFLSRPPADMGLLDLPEIPNEFDAAFLWLDYDASAN